MTGSPEPIARARAAEAPEAGPLADEPGLRGTRREWAVLAACAAAGAALRLPLLGQWGMTMGDGGTFAWMAYSLRRLDLAHGMSTRWPAGYPVHVALAQLLPGLGDPETAGRAPHRVKVFAVEEPPAHAPALDAPPRGG